MRGKKSCVRAVGDQVFSKELHALNHIPNRTEQGPTTRDSVNWQVVNFPKKKKAQYNKNCNR